MGRRFLRTMRLGLHDLGPGNLGQRLWTTALREFR
jgi:hypothetical protein